jgi:hypothetical protein
MELGSVLFVKLLKGGRHSVVNNAKSYMEDFL